MEYIRKKAVHPRVSGPKSIQTIDFGAYNGEGNVYCAPSSIAHLHRIIRSTALGFLQEAAAQRAAQPHLSTGGQPPIPATVISSENATDAKRYIGPHDGESEASRIARNLAQRHAKALSESAQNNLAPTKSDPRTIALAASKSSPIIRSSASMAFGSMPSTGGWGSYKVSGGGGSASFDPTLLRKTSEVKSGSIFTRKSGEHYSTGNLLNSQRKAALSSLHVATQDDSESSDCESDVSSIWGSDRLRDFLYDDTVIGIKNGINAELKRKPALSLQLMQAFTKLCVDEYGHIPNDSPSKRAKHDQHVNNDIPTTETVTTAVTEHEVAPPSVEASGLPVPGDTALVQTDGLAESAVPQTAADNRIVDNETNAENVGEEAPSAGMEIGEALNPLPQGDLVDVATEHAEVREEAVSDSLTSQHPIQQLTAAPSSAADNAAQATVEDIAAPTDQSDPLQLLTQALGGLIDLILRHCGAGRPGCPAVDEHDAWAVYSEAVLHSAVEKISQIDKEGARGTSPVMLLKSWVRCFSEALVNEVKKLDEVSKPTSAEAAALDLLAPTVMKSDPTLTPEIQAIIPSKRLTQLLKNALPAPGRKWGFYPRGAAPEATLVMNDYSRSLLHLSVHCQNLPACVFFMELGCNPADSGTFWARLDDYLHGTNTKTCLELSEHMLGVATGTLHSLGPKQIAHYIYQVVGAGVKTEAPRKRTRRNK